MQCKHTLLLYHHKTTLYYDYIYHALRRNTCVPAYLRTCVLLIICSSTALFTFAQQSSYQNLLTDSSTISPKRLYLSGSDTVNLPGIQVFAKGELTGKLLHQNLPALAERTLLRYNVPYGTVDSSSALQVRFAAPVANFSFSIAEYGLMTEVANSANYQQCIIIGYDAAGNKGIPLYVTDTSCTIHGDTVTIRKHTTEPISILFTQAIQSFTIQLSHTEPTASVYHRIAIADFTITTPSPSTRIVKSNTDATCLPLRVLLAIDVSGSVAPKELLYSTDQIKKGLLHLYENVNRKRIIHLEVISFGTKVESRLARTLLTDKSLQAGGEIDKWLSELVQVQAKAPAATLGATNWSAALDYANKYDATLFITNGSPNYYKGTTTPVVAQIAYLQAIGDLAKANDQLILPCEMRTAVGQHPHAYLAPLFDKLTDRTQIAALARTSSQATNSAFLYQYQVAFRALAAYAIQPDCRETDEQNTWFTLSPNPATDFVALQPSFDWVAQDPAHTVITATNELGQSVTIPHQWTGTAFYFNTAHLSAGVYYLRLQLADDKFPTARIVIAR